ncbi:MAG TPA: alpha/beta fold hydrolase [Ktedonobacterales bacterium]|nr:alpha/beta fold hydrolase [Ktedonobacterales bacterium]
MSLGELIAAGAAVAVGGSGFAFYRFAQRRTRALLTPIRKPLDYRPRDCGVAVEDVSFDGPRGRLMGWYLPATNGCTLICCHGIHDNRGQWIRQMARLHQRSGYGALMFDFAGHGDSEGNLVTYGVREAEEIGAAIAYLRARGDVAMDRLGVMGYSLGAISAVLAAAKYPELHAVVIESGFSDLKADIKLLFRRYTGLPSFPFAAVVVGLGQRAAGVRLDEIRPVRLIGGLSPRAVMIISDLKDELANEPYDGEQLFAAAGEPKVLWQIPDAGHVWAYDTQPDEWIARVGDFLDAHLAGAPASTSGAAPAAAAQAQPATPDHSAPVAAKDAPDARAS